MWENKVTVYLNYKFTSKFLLLVFLKVLNFNLFQKIQQKEIL